MKKIQFTSKKMLALKWLLNIIILLSFLSVCYCFYKRWAIEVETIELAKKDIDTQINGVVSNINLELASLMGTGQLFANELSDGTTTRANVEKAALDLIKQRKKQRINFFGIQIAFAKGEYNKNKPDELANWYFYYDKKTRQIDSTKADYDYTTKNNPDKDNSWFIRAIETKQAFWQEPHFGATTNEFIVGYSIPFFDSPKKEKAIGVITINLSIEQLKEILYAQDYRKFGYAILLSKEGNIIYHPDRVTTLLDAGKKITKLASSDNKHNSGNTDTSDFISYLKQQNKRADTFNLYNIPKVNKRAWVLSKHIPVTEWGIHTIAFEDEFKIPQKVIAIDLWLIISILIFIVMLSSHYLVFYYKKDRILWYISFIIGFAFCVGIGYLWHLAIIQEFSMQGDIEAIKSQKEVDDYKKSTTELANLIHKPVPIYIPTGVFIKSTQFEGSNNIYISGYIWQKYTVSDAEMADGIPEDFCNLITDTIPKGKGVVLFEAQEEKIDLSCNDVAYSAISDGIITLGWYFKVELREPFDYSNYPLDKNSIWLRLRPNSFDTKIILVPDLRAYPFIFEEAKAGIDANNLVLPSWHILSTFYTRQAIELGTNLGINGYVGQKAHDLLFNIIIERDFLDAFISTIIPICLIYLILFVILFSSLPDILAVLGINAGLLFSVALWHSGLRASLASSGITYFETFYFTCYLIISLICINSVLLASDASLVPLRYKNNLIPKLVFFPFVFGLTFIITLIVLF